jgi:cyclase
MRIISRLDIKNEFVIKGINLEGLRKIGDPIEIARQYYLNGIDEIILIDAVASLYGRNNLFEVVKRTTENLFIPITLGGGIKSLEDIDKALNSGADKIAINSAGIDNPSFIKEAVNNFGASTITIYIEAKKYKVEFGKRTSIMGEKKLA